MHNTNLKPYHSNGCIEAGCDEAGRGCLAGPVYAAAVILPENVPGNLASVLQDSKKISPTGREKVSEVIKQEALSYAVAYVDNEEIDRINILNASLLAMHLALEKLTIKPENIIVDGNRFNKYQEVPHICIVKGDGIYMSVAAASVLAKTCRDKNMISLHQQFPQYNWISNKGYPTGEHRKMINLHGLTPYHRRSFKMVKSSSTKVYKRE